MKKKIYLDYNIISYLRNNTFLELTQAFEILDKKNHMFVFSPAHLEDIAVTEMYADEQSRDEKAKIAHDEILFLEKLCGKNAFRPTNKLQPLDCNYIESPFDCYKRVIEKYNVNKYAENIDKAVLESAHQNSTEDTDPKIVNNLDVNLLMNKKIITDNIINSLISERIFLTQAECRKIQEWKFKDFTRKFIYFQTYVNMTANYLEKIGFHREKVSKYRSRLHDVSHIIYAAHTNIFVSDDKKLIAKTNAIYNLIDVPTKVMNKQQFINYIYENKRKLK